MEKENQKNIFEKAIDKSVDFIFSNNPLKWLVLIVLLGIILRFLVANNISALGDEMVHGPHIMGFINSGLISTILHSPLWFYLGDLVFKLFPVTLFTIRFLSFFYGIMTILVIYLLGSKIFNKTVALLSSFFLAVSFFTIRYTLAEMDLAATFFLMLGLYLFIISLEENKFPYLSAICLGLAALIKTLSLFFVPAFLLAFLFLNKSESKKLTNKIIKKIIGFGVLVGFFFLPIIIHNVIWFVNKGLVDTYVAQYFLPSVRPVYAGQLGYDSGLLFDKFISGLYNVSKTIFNYDPLIIILGLFGIYLTYQIIDKRKYWNFLITFILFGYILLLLSNHLVTHYTTLMPLLCLFAGFSLDNLIKRYNGNYSYKKVLTIIIIIILIFQLYFLMPHLTSRSALGKTRDYAINEMDKNSIVVTDARIYRGRIAFLFHDFHYIESTMFPELLGKYSQENSQKIPVKVYFVECVRDDCGWGTIDSGQLNQSSEQLFSYVKQQTTIEKTFYGGGGYDEETGDPYISIYSTTILMNPGIFLTVDSTHDWFYYPVNYEPKSKIFDSYDVDENYEIFLYNLAKIILLFSAILAIAFAFIPFYKLFKQ